MRGSSVGHFIAAQTLIGALLGHGCSSGVYVNRRASETGAVPGSLHTIMLIRGAGDVSHSSIKACRG